MTPQLDPKLIEFVEQQDIQRKFRDPISHLWTVVHESSLDEDTSVGRSALFVEPGARQRVIEHGPGWPRGYENGPAFVESWGGDGRVREYLPTGNDEDLHPLVVTQSFYGLKPDPARDSSTSSCCSTICGATTRPGTTSSCSTMAALIRWSTSRTVGCSSGRICCISFKRPGSGTSFSGSTRVASGSRHRGSIWKRSAPMSYTISITPAWWVEAATRLAASHGSTG